MFTCRFLRRYSLDVRAATPRLDSLRSRLERGPGLDEFASGTTTPEQQKPITAAERRRANHVRLPEWLKTAPPVGRNYQRIKSDLAKLNLSTVCVEAKCPNIGECWGGTDSGTATATIMLMGDECTRGCRFCSVKTSRAPAALDENEPMNTSEAVSRWGLDYVVLTSVDRDDLPDGGASHFAKTVRLLKEKSPSILVECLTGDFQGNSEHVALVANSGLDVYTHNVETVERLTPYVRDRRAGYRQSLGVLEHAKKTRPTLVTKSSIMVGCGETFEEILQTFRDLRSAGVEAVTLGQYMRPTTRHMKVVEYVHPDVFKQYETEARQAGFRVVASGPLVRSSYKAAEFYLRDLVRGAQRKASPQLQAGASAVADGRHSIA